MKPKRPELGSIYSKEKSVTFLYNSNAQLEMGAGGDAGEELSFTTSSNNTKKLGKKETHWEVSS